MQFGKVHKSCISSIPLNMQINALFELESPPIISKIRERVVELHGVLHGLPQSTRASPPVTLEPFFIVLLIKMLEYVHTWLNSSA